MNMEFLLKAFGKYPRVQEICNQLNRGCRAIQVEGMNPAAKGLFATVLAAAAGRPVLLITYNQDQAERLFEDISMLNAPGLDLRLMPSADGMIYTDGGADPDAVAGRISALTRLSSGGRCIIVAPISAVLQRTFAPECPSDKGILLQKGKEVSLDECARRLADMGYKRVDLVGGPAEFSLRGGILDIFTATEPFPVRIELFGDDIESIRRFEVESQRSTGSLDSIEVNPAREILISSESAGQAAQALSHLLRSESERVEAEFGREAAARLRRRVEEDILHFEGGACFDGMEYYLPILCNKEYSLLDSLPRDAVLLLDEPHQIENHWAELYQELLESLESRVRRGEVLRLPGAHAISFESFTEWLGRRNSSVLLSILPRPLSWMCADGQVSLPVAPMDVFSAQIALLIEQIKTWLANRARILLITRQPHRIIELLGEHDLSVRPIEDLIERGKSGVYVAEGAVRAGFKLTESNLMVLTDTEMFGAGRPRRQRKTFRKGTAITSLLDIAEGDFVVHINHGIGRYRGLTKLGGNGGDRDYLVVEYAGTDKLYVPTDQIDRIQRFIGADGQAPTLNKLGGMEWAKTTKRVKASVKEMAKELVALYAARQSLDGYSYSPDTPWQQELESAFRYEETPDQLAVIREIKEDLESAKPMDRLVCGDVGYGKTEVAIRAVFKVVNDGRQVAVLAPTTVLAQQHFNTFAERFAAYPVTVGMLSRFKTRSEQKKIVEGLRTGDIDVVIGTHRLLSKDIEFKNLGLLVVDEEQRFGVAHKERLKQLRKTVDVLTLSATPIPRTLHMSLSGIRDMSLINDPPEGRAPIKTFCREYEDDIVRDAILRELDRGGQVYFVHNRVENIEHVAEHLRKLAPHARVAAGHGQMSEDELEQVMMDLYEGESDILVCTTIIESGLDVPNVNTIIINNADKMGLAQLYQLRGRVGRSNRQAYAYLLYEPHRVMSEIAEKRLQAIREFSDLGSGFKIALRDLEIRGAGNLLGPQQHGQMQSVGFDMYCQLLSEAVQEIKGEAPEQFELPPADLPMDAFIPARYVPTEAQRLSLYKKMTSVRHEQDVEKIEEELRDRFGEIPRAVSNSLGILKLRIKSAGIGVEAITHDRSKITIKLAPGIRLAPDVCIRLRKKFGGCVFMADRVLVDSRSPRLLKLLGYILDDLPAELEDSKLYFMAMI